MAFSPNFGDLQAYRVDTEAALLDPGDQFGTPQRNFIEQDGAKLVALQGPPGTGKTFTTAPAVHGRASTFNNPCKFRGYITSHAHDAVDQVLKEVVEIQDELRNAGKLQNKVNIFRIHPSQSNNKISGVDYINYQNYDDVDHVISECFENQDCPVLWFAPPTSLRGLIDSVVERYEFFEEESAEKLLEEGVNNELFQLGVVDEASMMDLPQFFTVSGYISEQGQSLFIGDHRQLPPIQKHDWENEWRKPIEEHTPELSVLDFIRFLRDELDNVDYLLRDPPDFTSSKRDRYIPMERLNESYRLPNEIAELLQELIYYKDGINFHGQKGADKIPDPTNGSNQDVNTPLAPSRNTSQAKKAEVLDRDKRVTVITYESTGATKFNRLEVEVITSLLEPYSFHEQGADRLTGGVTIPYRRQQSAVRSVVPKEVKVDTVNGFQGGERDLMILGMTAADSGAILGGRNFILDPRRFCVGVSRAKQKLIIIASEAMFEAIPPNADSIDTKGQDIWIRLGDAIGRTHKNPNPITLKDFVGHSVSDCDDSTKMRIYHF